MSGGRIVAVRGGIDVRTDDLRAAAGILADVAASVRSLADGVATAARTLLIYDLDLQFQVAQGGPTQALTACDAAVRAARRLRSAADEYDGEESAIERLIGDAQTTGRNAGRLALWGLSLGHTNLDLETAQLEDKLWLAHQLGLAHIFATLAAIREWRTVAKATSTGTDTSRAGRTPPARFGDLPRGLDELGSTGTADIAVRFLECPDGVRRVIVDLPGTAEWSPWTTNVADITSGVLALVDFPSAYADAVVSALEQAGVGPEDEILLNGYSLGGMTAAYLAHRLSGPSQFPGRRYNVVAVVTAGAPIGRVDVPDDVTVLALENSSDVVPILDGARNDDGPNVTTVVVDTDAWVGDAHTLEAG